MKNLESFRGNFSERKVDRRSFLRGMAGAIGVAALGTVATACGDDEIMGSDPWDLDEIENCREPELCRGQRLRCRDAERGGFEGPEYCDGYEDPLTSDEIRECILAELCREPGFEAPDFCDKW